MKFLILDGPRDPQPIQNPLYRGTYRRHPSHCDELPDDHEINKLFFWFLEEGGELGVVGDLSKALRFAELWNTHLGERCFEVVEVADEGICPQSNGTLMGFDLAAGYNNSLLWWGLRQFLSVNELRQPIREFYDLVTRFYAPQLNGQGLFSTHQVASLCLRSMVALQDLSPNLFEGGSLNAFRVIGLYLLS